MQPDKFLEILNTVGKLKVNTRHNWTDGDRKESVADHSWRLALMAMLLTNEPEFGSLDMNRVIRMCLIHDIGEAFTGDIPAFEKTDRDSDLEDALFDRFVAAFPAPQKDEWQSLLSDMKTLATPEARLYKALDKLEAVISHNEADLSSWLPLEYELQLTYANAQTAYSPWLTALREVVDAQTRQKIASAPLTDQTDH